MSKSAGIRIFIPFDCSKIFCPFGLSGWLGRDHCIIWFSARLGVLPGIILGATVRFLKAYFWLLFSASSPPICASPSFVLLRSAFGQFYLTKVTLCDTFIAMFLLPSITCSKSVSLSTAGLAVYSQT